MNLIVTVDDAQYAQDLMNKIKSMEHVMNVEMKEDDMILIANERLEEYRKSSDSAISLEEFKTLFKKS
jgi:non-homologous end joining protein Ku